MRSSLTLLVGLLLPAVALANTPFPGGLLDTTGRTAFLAASTGIVAVDLTAGEIRWSNDEASEPLFVIDHRLYALAPSRSGRLFIRGLDLGERGQRDFESEPIELPRWGVPGNGPGHSFTYTWKRDRNHLTLHWQIAAWTEGTPRKQSAGIAIVDLETGKVRQQKTNTQAASVTVTPFLQKLSVRWKTSDAGRTRAVLLEERPDSSAHHRRQQFVLRCWNEKSGKEVWSRELLQGRELTLLPDCDGRHLWLRDATSSVDIEKEAGRYWLVANVTSGRPVYRVPYIPGTLAVTTHDRKAYCLATTKIRLGKDRRATKGRALVAIDLASGRIVWQRPLGEGGQR